MSDYTDTWNRLFGTPPVSESEAERLLRDLDRVNAIPEPTKKHTMVITFSDAYDIAAAMSYASYLMGPCKETNVLAKFRKQLDEELD